MTHSSLHLSTASPDDDHSQQSSTASGCQQQTISHGQVYLWNSNGTIKKEILALPRLDNPHHLSGRFVAVYNDSVTKLPGSNNPEGVPLGNAKPDSQCRFVFEPHHGGGRMEKRPFIEAEMWQRYIDASRFGEVNTYYHTDKVAKHIDDLLNRLGYPSLPQLIVRVNAHSAVGKVNGCCNGVLGKESNKWYPLQGGHYRLPTDKRLTVKEYRPLSTAGEVHLGPGWKLTQHGALADFVGGKYRCNASHNAGTIYHEYGHHLTQHTADFRNNKLKAPHRQCNIKTDLDEAFCDYLAATMMDSPHIWAFHHRHDSEVIHRRSLASRKTMADYDHQRDADPHDNGTILAATLWDLRKTLTNEATTQVPDASQLASRQAIIDTDLMVVYSLLLIGQLLDHPTNPSIKKSRKLRKGFGTVLQALLESDQRLFSGKYQKQIRDCFENRGIQSDNAAQLAQLWSSNATVITDIALSDPRLEKLQQKTSRKLPQTSELLSSSQLDAELQKHKIGPYSLVAVGDVMVGSRARHRTNEFGPNYIFESVKPLFRRASIVLGNQEGPIARDAKKLPRNHSYKVDPMYTRVLRRGGFHVMTLANNHLLDCGRDGVKETLLSLQKHGIHAIGVGNDLNDAHQPTILQAGEHTVGLLGYYWNRRTAARTGKPGSAQDTPETLTKDITQLRELVDRVVVTVHWGVPYEREPSDQNREKAKLMVSLGADIVIGHHAHIMQEVELINGRPVIYGIGNFAFGTGNSKAESLAVGVDFMEDQTVVDFYPTYVKNRDPRVNFQPKIMTGSAAEETLQRFASLSVDGQQIEIDQGIGRLYCPVEKTSNRS